MRVLKLDFIQRPSLLRGLSFMLLAIAVTTAAYLTQRYLQRSGELDGWENKYRNLRKTQQRQSSTDPVRTAEWEHLQEELKTANRVIAQLATPWDTLFHEVEASVGDQVTLLGVEPDTEKRELRLIAEAKDLDAMLAYARRLQDSALFSDAYVVSHQIQQQDPQKPVRFVVNAQWTALAQSSVGAQKVVAQDAMH